MLASSAVDPSIGRRVAVRTRCDLVVEIKDSLGEWRRAQLRDFSATGCRMSRFGALPSGNSLWLRPQGMEPIPAKVRWRTDGSLGCEFLYPLDESTESALKQLIADDRARHAARCAVEPTREFAWHSL